MIERIVIENFKSFKKVDIQLGPFNLFIGTNASGKSNFFDALRVLQGIGNGFTISEILDGKPKSATSEVWDGIRGGSAKACFADEPSLDDITFHVSGSLPNPLDWRWDYELVFSPRSGCVVREKLNVGPKNIYDSGKASPTANATTLLEVQYNLLQDGSFPILRFDSTRPVIGQFAKGNGSWDAYDAELARAVMIALADAQHLDLWLTLLRSYSSPQAIRRMGEHGENFAALIATICHIPKTKDAYLAWLKELRPAELDDVGILRGAVGEPLFMLREGGRDFPAQILSDGTLRFAAITAAFFQPDAPQLITIEEIENGLHASRLRLLVELLRNRANSGRAQILATTHSPIVLAWLKDTEYGTTYFCKRDETTGESRICPLPDVPGFNDVVKKQPISELFSEGWLEAAL